MALAYVANDPFRASETFAGASPVTGAAPAGPTDWFDVTGLDQVTLVVDALSSSFAGGGQFNGYFKDPVVGLVTRAPGLDFVAPASGIVTQTYDPVDVFSFKGGLIKWVPSAITITAAAAGCKLWIVGYQRNERFMR